MLNFLSSTGEDGLGVVVPSFAFSLNILMTISEVVIVFFSFFFYCIQSGRFKSTKKQFGILTVLGISQKQLKRLIFIENMLIGALSIFLAFNLTCLFTVLLLVTAKITHVPGLYLYPPTSAIVLTIIIFRALHSRIIFYTDAHSHEKSRTSFKRRKTTKERKASVLISLYLRSV